ncbi:MAG TPA: T9SS type A sorting domain-containing protein [Puia sp.]|nr:T9SS type A sorting domain-containing protein [Puia sp.]
MLEPETPVARLTWTTTDGEAEPYYVVERSYDALNFKSIDTVSSASDSAIVNGHSYILTDPHILPGYNYYRLCLVYPDGDTSYSVLQRVSYLPGLSGLRLSPNPTTSRLWLDLTQAPAGTLLVNVLDDQGRTIRKWVFQNQFNYWREAIDVADLAPGSYVLQLAGQGTQTSQVFIKR